MSSIVLISGSEALARGAYQAGADFVGGFPGMPVNDILDATDAFSSSTVTQRATNEKVALEVALGIARGGGRALVVLQHTGLNTASDPLITSAYSGTNGGLVIAVIDDPGMLASMSEQDSRHFARTAKIPMLAPSDSQEIVDFTALAFRLSEKHDMPVLLHLTTRLCNTRSLCTVAEPEPVATRTPVLSNARSTAANLTRHEFLEKQLVSIRTLGNQAFELNSVDVGTSELGIITAGISYGYAKEVLPDASFLKLGMIHPLPDKLISYFSSLVRSLYVIEELDPFIEEQIRAAGIAIRGKEIFPAVGELSSERVAIGLAAAGNQIASGGPALVAGKSAAELPARASHFCDACLYRTLMGVFKRMQLTIVGDVGCFRPGERPPTEPDGVDACFCIGSSMSIAYGLALKQNSAGAHRTVAVLSGSTFIHSGLQALANIVQHGGDATVCILVSPGSAGYNAVPASIDFVKLCEGVGVTAIRGLNPGDDTVSESVLDEELRRPGVSVIIVQP